MERGPNDEWLRFDIDPRATFADGRPVRAEDVRFTFDLLMSKGSLKYRTQFADVARVTVERLHSVRFDLKPEHGRTLALDLASLPVMPEHDLQQRDFANGAGFDKPVGSGPYRIGRIDNGRSITFERDPAWWARDLPASRGRYNFDKLRIEYFGDTEVARQVLKGGGYDYNREFSATAYTLGYNGAQLDDGRLQRAHLGPAKPQVAQGFVFNLDQPQFKDRRVRQALGMLWDFEWSNRQMMRNLYIRQQSVFSNTPLAARQLPDAGELKLLAPCAAKCQMKCSPRCSLPRSPMARGSSVNSSCRPWPCSNKPAGTPKATAWSIARARRWRSRSSMARRALNACCCRGSATWPRSA